MIEKPDGYYTHVRPELANMVRPDARNIVDVGCGGGALGAFLKKNRPGVCVAGIEREAAPAAAARAVLDAVVEADVETVSLESLPFGPGEVDCLIFADVLEHLTYPWQVLRRFRPLLRPDGQVIVSLPNVRNLKVVGNLLRGRWEYEKEGILDNTHLRFFTLATAVDVLRECGFGVRGLTASPDGDLAALVVPEGGSIKAQVRQFTINELTDLEAAEFRAFQFFLDAAPRESLAKEAGLRVVVRATGTPSVFADVLARLLDGGWPVTVWDDGEAPQLEEAVSALEQCGALTRVKTDPGSSPALGMNAALVAAGDASAVFVESQAWLGEGGLTRLAEHLRGIRTKQGAGLVGPVTNLDGSSHLIQHDFEKAEASPARAATFADKVALLARGRATPSETVPPWCFGVGRSAWDGVQGFDPLFRSSAMALLDFGLRASRSGFPTIMARDVYAWYQGAVAPAERGGDAAWDWRLFKLKWDLPADRLFEQRWSATELSEHAEGEPVATEATPGRVIVALPDLTLSGARRWLLKVFRLAGSGATEFQAPLPAGCTPDAAFESLVTHLSTLGFSPQDLPPVTLG